MTYEDLYWAFVQWGYPIKPEYRQRFMVYLMDMMKRKRVGLISDKEGLVAVFTFFLTDNHEPLANKPEFSIPDDNTFGPEIYVDKLVSKRWDLGVRRAIQDFVETNFPDVKVGFWHRQPNNRCVITYKRGTNYAGKSM